MKTKSAIDPKIVMLEHSQAKVKLYIEYLAIYLNILSRAGFIDKIYLYDLMCGEGIYADGSKGSPVAALETIKNHYYRNGNRCIDMVVLFNDNGVSDIEPGRTKIDRVKEKCHGVFIPQNVEIRFDGQNYSDIYPIVINQIATLNGNERALLFIDPYGYKDVRPSHIQEFMKGGKSEVILFLPAHHMYRFAEKSIFEGFPGGEPLQKFIEDLFADDMPIFDSPIEFIHRVRDKFRSYLKEKNVFVDIFIIERGAQTLYSLFFFTSKIRGYEKMLEVKWRLDKDRGKGFRREGSGTLFSEMELENYPEKLATYIKSDQKRSNEELRIFGLQNGFLPKHTNEILRKWQQTDPKFEILDVQCNPLTRKGVFYLTDSTKTVYFHFKN